MKRIFDWAARCLLGAMVAAGLGACDVPRLGPDPATPPGVPTPLATMAPTASPAAPTLAAAAPTGASPEALAYLTYAVDYIEQHGLHSDQVDWPAVRARVFNADLTAQTPADTYPVIQSVLDELPVHGHSFLWTPEQVASIASGQAAAPKFTVSYAQRSVRDVDPGSAADRAGVRAGDTIVTVNDAPVESMIALQFFSQLYFGSGVKLGLRRGAGPLFTAQIAHEEVTPGPLASGGRLAGNIGYIAVPGLDPGSPLVPYYADIMQQIIAETDQTPTCGWVVDLQGNTGGNMWPMLAGIGPILGEGPAGSFAPPANGSAWTYRDGQALLGTMVQAQAPAPYHLRRPDPPVAVLTDKWTASAGEAIAVAFRGRPQTRSFGGATAGVPTANAGVRLSDGAELVLTMAMDADRTGQAYDAPLEPDVPTFYHYGDRGTEADPALRAAVAWLRQQPACAAP